MVLTFSFQRQKQTKRNASICDAQNPGLCRSLRGDDSVSIWVQNAGKACELEIEIGELSTLTGCNEKADVSKYSQHHRDRQD